MNRQLSKGPQIFHSESRASLPGAGGSLFPLVFPHSRSGQIHVPPLQGLPSSGIAWSLWCLFFLQYSMKQHYLTVFGTIASSLSSFIFGLVSFSLFFLFVFNEPDKPKMMYLKHREQYWFGVKVMWGPVWTCWLCWGRGGRLGLEPGDRLHCCLAVPASLS